MPFLRPVATYIFTHLPSSSSMSSLIVSKLGSRVSHHWRDRDDAHSEAVKGLEILKAILPRPSWCLNPQLELPASLVYGFEVTIKPHERPVYNVQYSKQMVCVTETTGHGKHYICRSRWRAVKMLFSGVPQEGSETPARAVESVEAIAADRSTGSRSQTPEPTVLSWPHYDLVSSRLET